MSVTAVGRWKYWTEGHVIRDEACFREAKAGAVSTDQLAVRSTTVTVENCSSGISWLECES